MNVALDALAGTYPGGWVETPTTVADQAEALEALQRPEELFPQPSKAY